MLDTNKSVGTCVHTSPLDSLLFMKYLPATLARAQEALNVLLALVS